MSGDASVITDVTPPGPGLALDLGGGAGKLHQPLRRLGYRYVNLDIQRFQNGEPSVVGSAQALPFRDTSFDVVVCKEALTAFLQPWIAVKEVHRVLKPGGLFIVSAGFMWPDGAGDFYRFTRFGLRHLVSDFEIVSMDSPLSIFSMLGSLLSAGLARLRLSFAEQMLRRLCYWLDRGLMRIQKRPSAFAASYRIVARKNTGNGGASRTLLPASVSSRQQPLRQGRQ